MTEDAQDSNVADVEPTEETSAVPATMDAEEPEAEQPAAEEPAAEQPAVEETSAVPATMDAEEPEDGDQTAMVEDETSAKRTSTEAGVDGDGEGEPKKKARIEEPAVDNTNLEEIPLAKDRDEIKTWLQSMEPKALLEYCADLMVKYPDFQREVKSKLHKDPKLCKLFIRGLNWDTTKEKLKEVFEEFGTVVEANIIMDKQMNRSKGYGFITMSTAEEAQKALADPKKEIDNRQTHCNLASDRTQQRAYQQQRGR